ncbi:MAG TPA: YdiU family protein [Polyangiales bacterium]|nr:YdiU family protein [Polyangiales bacterium]
MERSLEALTFDNSFVRSLPGDPLTSNERRQVRDAAYSRVAPTSVRAPRTLAYSPEVAALLGLSREACESPLFAEVFSGNRVLPGMEPYAACYGGHQFGNWAGQLGDGRAITLGEAVGPNGRWELQLKGAGPTPYSRSGDGRAVLRSSLREFLCSEAMFFLGIPTTRALSLVDTGERVVRDMFYDGRPSAEPGAVVCRVAPSFVRFGNFEILAARRAPALIAKLADYVIETHQPELAAYTGKERYLRWFEHVCRVTTELVVHWMRVGFVHGVMNTDNMSVLGLTIDYGPYGFLDAYDPLWTPNTTDAAGRRYRYEHQPSVALWNLNCLANALLVLTEETAPLEAALNACADGLATQLDRMHCQKLGFVSRSGEAVELATSFSAQLAECQLDMTNSYRALIDLPDAEQDAARLAQHLVPASYAELGPTQLEALGRWLQSYQRVRAEEGIDPAKRREQMQLVNPRFILRNYMAQLAIESAEAGDISVLRELHQLIHAPYAEQPGQERWTAKRPDWAAHKPGCSMLSCSS